MESGGTRVGVGGTDRIGFSSEFVIISGYAQRFPSGNPTASNGGWRTSSSSFSTVNNSHCRLSCER